MTIEPQGRSPPRSGGKRLLAGAGIDCGALGFVSGGLARPGEVVLVMMWGEASRLGRALSPVKGAHLNVKCAGR